MPFSMSSLLRNLIEAKANIQIQKTGAEISFYVKISAMSTRIVFMGSPVFAVPILEALFHAYQVTGVVTQPDRPSGRGKILTSPPVKDLAVKFQPAAMLTNSIVQRFQSRLLFDARW